MLNNLSKALIIMSNETATALTTSQTSLDSMARVVLDNHSAVDYMLTEQGGVRMTVNPYFCSYINS